MLKYFCLCLIGLLGSFSVQAQQEKKYVYEDTAYTLPPPQNDPVETIIESDQEETTVVEAPVEDDEMVSTEVAIDTSLYPNNLVIANDSVQRLRSKGELAYARHLDSLLKAAQDKQKKEKPDKPLPDITPPTVSLGFLTPILWVLGIGFVLFILYTLFLKDGAFRKASKKAPITEEAQQEEVKLGSDMDRLIRQALQNKNYRLAIRYQYLNCLHQLANKGLVQFAVDKTNYQYVSELTNPQQRNEFAKLTLHYEYAWYGEFDIDEALYQKIEPGFTAFYNKI